MLDAKMHRTTLQTSSRFFGSQHPSGRPPVSKRANSAHQFGAPGRATVPRYGSYLAGIPNSASRALPTLACSSGVRARGYHPDRSLKEIPSPRLTISRPLILVPGLSPIPAPLATPRCPSNPPTCSEPVSASYRPVLISTFDCTASAPQLPLTCTLGGIPVFEAFTPPFGPPPPPPVLIARFGKPLPTATPPATSTAGLSTIVRLPAPAAEIPSSPPA